MSCLLEERQGAVAILTLNRPEARNAFSPELIVRLDEACLRLRDDASVRAIVLNSSSEKAFCAGGDLKLTIPLITGARKPSDDFDHALLGLMKEKGRPLPINSDVGKPLIAAIEGSALGGGLELALACDIIVASRSASFAAPEVSAGAYPARITYLLPRRVPYSIAARVLLEGHILEAEQAFAHGLASALTEQGQALEKAMAIASKIAGNAPISVKAARHVAITEMMGERPKIEKLDRRMVREVYASEDAREGPRAFAEKRRPDFKGR